MLRGNLINNGFEAFQQIICWFHTNVRTRPYKVVLSKLAYDPFFWYYSVSAPLKHLKLEAIFLYSLWVANRASFSLNDRFFLYDVSNSMYKIIQILFPHTMSKHDIINWWSSKTSVDVNWSSLVKISPFGSLPWGLLIIFNSFPKAGTKILYKTLNDAMHIMYAFFTLLLYSNCKILVLSWLLDLLWFQFAVRINITPIHHS